MVSQFCWGCLSGFRQTPRALLPRAQLPTPSLTPSAASFHTSAVRYANPLNRKTASRDNAPKFRESKSARMRKNKKPVDRGRPPAVGERKALRKRIVLSNTNALEVQGMQEFSNETIVDSRLRGAVVGLPVPIVSQLRAVQAFKPTQGWSLFRRPAVVLRRETLEMGKVFENITDGGDKGKVVKKIIIGPRGSGKSVQLLQAMAIGFLKKWVVISIPEAQDMVTANSAYAPIAGSQPVQYVQDQLTSALLLRTSLGNEDVLSKLHVSLKHPELKHLIRPKMTLNELLRLGVQDTSISWPVFNAFWAEMNATSGPEGFQTRPPLLVAADGIGHWMLDSKYRNPEYKFIHAHDFALVKHFLSLLRPGSSQSALSNGGILLYSTSASNKPSTPTFDLALQQLASRRSGVSESSPEFPRADPYDQIDNRVVDIFKPSATRSATEDALDLQILGGLSRDEARGLMEYFARSGILQERVSEDWIGEKWSLAGGGLVGEMEKLGSRLKTAL
ncbi:mitochondrial ribosomal death-associated protein 3-domain-containing protein [Talaromyces proteolyticus]|uniref:Small ribosomal subunit protein mS29 n=1 Tax=Talaromyces proteolyticus TaxID=1131652 RepID=A0AAD4KGY8_9EURO|nr:mitochondrial ribosomal death-associated protein 3-domain-containing protein [Talaromyces proteolyticus]KAH8690858.1 mitochondrial ribosomal death-associated protein 3-domain-containing protein [Talaromyces proteolyticus]